MFEVGDRVIYEGYEFTVKFKTKDAYTTFTLPYPQPLNKGDLYRLEPVYDEVLRRETDDTFPFHIDAWIHEDLIKLDKKYYREHKINQICN